MNKRQKRKLQQIKQIIPIVAGLCLLTVVTIVYVVAPANKPTNPQRLVTFYDRGVERSILTRAVTVGEALQAAEIEVDSHDIVDPTVDSRFDESYEDIIIYRSRPVAVIDGSIHQTVVTVAQSPNKILNELNMQPLGKKDKATFRSGNIVDDGAFVVLNIERSKLEKRQVVFVPRPDALTVSKGAQVFVDTSGVAHRETYYDLPMNIVIKTCGANGSYTVRPQDGAKVDQDGYVLVAANLGAYPRCTIVETSLGPGKVYDTGGFALRHPYGFDLATDWTNHNGL